METGERLKGNEPGINTFPHQDGCDLGKRLKKRPRVRSDEADGACAGDEAQGDGINTFPHQDGCELGKRLKKGPVYEVIRLKELVLMPMRPKALPPAMI